ncbi:thioredoxin family protein [Sulfurospirillum sp. 1307]|jgi:thioredoxin-related protein
MRIFLIALLFISSAFSDMIELSTDWYRNLDEAKAQARELKKPILLFIHSRNCFYCPKMIEKVFPDPKLSKQLKEDFILVSLDGSTDADSIEEDVNDQAPTRFITSVTPAIFFMGPNEEKLTRSNKKHMVIFGYWNVTDMSEWANDALKRFKKMYGEKYVK